MKKALITSLLPKVQESQALVNMKINLARKKMMISLVFSIILRRSVRFTDLAEVLNDDIEEASNLRRIQSFIAEYNLSYSEFAILLASFLPKGKWTVCLDRTNWKFGKTYYNILAITVYSKGVGIPLLFEFLENKGGNSNEAQRIKLLTKFIKIFGAKKIKTIIGDREFIGEKWFKWLITNKISFYMRIKKNTIIEIDNEFSHSAKSLAYPKRTRFLTNVKLYGQKVNLAIKKTKKLDKNGEFELLIIATNSIVENALKIYKKRWSIEVFFQSLKSRGFNLEKTHLHESYKLKKIVVLASLAFAISFQAGVWKNKNIRPIKMKNHGYLANSFFRYGLDFIRAMFKNTQNNSVYNLDFLNFIFARVKNRRRLIEPNYLIISQKLNFIM